MSFLIVVLFVFFLIGFVFKVAFGALKFAFKFTFWIFELVLVIIGGAFVGGSILAFLGLVFAANVLFLPAVLLLGRR